MRAWRTLLGFGCLFGWLMASEIGVLIEDLGAEKLEVRLKAQESLVRLAEATPRQIIIELARAYGETNDLEVEARLEAVLSRLAREWMFYHPPGFMGINFRMVSLENQGSVIEVLQVIPGGAAEDAGIRANDRILSFNGTEINDMPDQEAFADTIAALQPGSLVELVVLRNGRSAQLRLALGVRDVEYINIPEASRAEEEKIRSWLISLRKDSGKNPEEPMGHFKASGLPERTQ